MAARYPEGAPGLSTCRHPGCGASLRRHNTLGYCRPHKNEGRVAVRKARGLQKAGKYLTEAERKAGRAAVLVKYRAAHPSKSAEDEQVRRSRKAGLSVERVYRTVVWKRDAGVCHLCLLPADPADWHLDHVLPIAAKGTHEYANVAVSHPLCNRQKQARPGSADAARLAEALAAFKRFHGAPFPDHGITVYVTRMRPAPPSISNGGVSAPGAEPMDQDAA